MTSHTYAWQWPDVGPTPVSYGLDAEIFDSEKFPNAQTFVREAIQNSLDARLDSAVPVRVRFSFNREKGGEQSAFLADLEAKKATSGLAWPEEWSQGEVSWLAVQDYNSSGLLGDVHSRTSDFWNYWLNFGLSNKTGVGRGGRGIGRVTFLIASRISTVIGLTRRSTDGQVHACGMSVLKPVMVGDELKTSYAYLTKSPQRNIFELYSTDSFHRELAESFAVEDHLKGEASGLALVIPYPHQDLAPDKLIAAAIENFAPAIINDFLVVEIDSKMIDALTIDAEAVRVANSFTSPAMREAPTRLLDLIRKAKGSPTETIRVERIQPLTKIVSQELQSRLRDCIENGDCAVLKLEVPVTRNSVTTYSSVMVAIRRTEAENKPIDMFYREGMALPEVVARFPADIDLVVQANEGELATYLNFCEGKAHLDLLENRDVKDKLRENGFWDGVTVKRFIRRLMDDARALALPDMTNPDATIMSGFFSVPRKDPEKQRPGSGANPKGEPNPPRLTPDKAPPPPAVPAFLISTLKTGFRIAANPQKTGFPASFRLDVAYANGARKPRWSPLDFDLRAMKIAGDTSKLTLEGNTIFGLECGADFACEITGFDTRRELVAILNGKVQKDA